MSDEIHDSPQEWVAGHIKKYVESDGQEGYEWNGFPTLLLTTRGRKSGQLHRTALIYGQDGDHYVIVGSRGGSDHHPSWYLNLVANPEVQVQVKADKFKALAHTASPEERAKLWPLMVKVFPRYAKYQEGTKREIPVIVLVRQ
ncbi:MAG TPA: nitroreductase family deazaflavin-dependent oxidoreductase [Phototrophicaceae bacterium]|nr:nitroreductase family deazaflavin-dependent oxidoreductase [Phototrophicaceae bacterium]